MKYTERPQYFPIASPSFEDIRKQKLTYVDKTDLIYNMTNTPGANYIFLSRPRRFGKSLLLSTLKSYFEGRKDLFEGLAIEKLETEWKKYPVFHFSMSTAKHVDKEQLETELFLKLSDYEKIYGSNELEIKTNQKFLGVVKRAYEQTGEKAVILIDEYDAPLLDVVHEEENLPILRKVMRNFYSPLKDLAPYVHFVFLTGITKFSQLSIFSELNNIKNISMNPQYASICGITEEEMEKYMHPGIEYMAQQLEITYEETLQKLKAQYDGYHFTWPSPDIYNPYSLLNALEDCQIDNYWFGSGTPTYLIEMLRKFEIIPEKIGGDYAQPFEFDTPTERLTSITPLLYQSGYITIKDGEDGAYLLEIPNKEVRVGLMQSLLPEYVTKQREAMANSTITKLYFNFKKGEIDEALTNLQEFLATIPYTENTNYEGHYQSMMYVIFSCLGYYKIDIEVRSLKGRIDMVLVINNVMYLFELKFNKTAQEALEQINIKNYDARFALYDLPIVKIGMNFSCETRTISEWVVER